MEDDKLVSELRHRGVHYLSGDGAAVPNLSDAELMAALASSTNARVRHGLVAWLLVHPEAHEAAIRASTTLSAQARASLRFLYSAAVRLQCLHGVELRDAGARDESLPDYFGDELPRGARDPDPKAALQGLANAQMRDEIDWVGTCEHIVRNVLRELRTSQR